MTGVFAAGLGVTVLLPFPAGAWLRRLAPGGVKLQRPQPLGGEDERA